MNSRRSMTKIVDLGENSTENSEIKVITNEQIKVQSPSTKSTPTAEAIHINFPRPTLISSILSRLSQVFKYTFVMEPKLDRRVQVFSPGPVAPEEAFKIFSASLGAVGLRIIFLDNRTIKIAKKPALKTHV